MCDALNRGDHWYPQS